MKAILKIINKISDIAGKFMGPIILACGIIALIKPSTFVWAKAYTTTLLSVIMFGMGMTLKFDDIKKTLKKPQHLLLGCVAQFTIMPLSAYAIAKIFHLPAELAIGLILVGTCPGGTASNVMTYLAKGDVTYSVGMTSVSTLAAPIMTPFLTWLLAGQWVEVPFLSMMITVAKVILVPIAVGAIANRFVEKCIDEISKILSLMAIICIALVAASAVAGSADTIKTSGVLICAALLLQNVAGYGLGFAVAKFFKLPMAKRNALAIEVGMQNTGLACTLATANFASAPMAAIPGAVGSILHQITGSFLANYMAKRSFKEKEQEEEIAKNYGRETAY